MRCVKNPSMVPPGRWSHRVHETNTTIEGGTKDSLVTAVARHLQANHKDIPGDLDWIVQEQICQRPGADKFCYECAASGWTGLGDVIYSFANPIARAIDAVAGTNVAGCRGCGKRRARLNAAFPIKA